MRREAWRGLAAEARDADPCEAHEGGNCAVGEPGRSDEKGTEPVKLVLSKHGMTTAAKPASA